MIRGIGIDLVRIEEVERFINSNMLKKAFITRNFTEREQNEAKRSEKKAEYLATRFASKEAVYKTVAHLLPDKTFDMRIIETLNKEDGSPYININEEFAGILKSADIDVIHISITTEDGYAAAFAVGEKY